MGQLELPNLSEPGGNMIKLGRRIIGNDAPCFIIAEIGINHNSDLTIAKQLIDVAAEAGCDAVKFQAFKAERLYPKSAGKLDWMDNNKEYSYDIFEASKNFETPTNWWPKLHAYAKKKEIFFFASVCDEETAEIVSGYMDLFKATSFAITHTHLLKYMAQKNKPLIFSTGASTLEEIKEAYNNIKDLNKDIIILHCVSQYPTPLNKVNLLSIDTLKENFPKAVIGFSDHTIEPTDAPVAAIIKGAKVIEKHITLNRKMKGPDHFFALEPKMLKNMVTAIRMTENALMQNKYIKINHKMLGSYERTFTDAEKYQRSFGRGTVMTTKAMKKGQIIAEKDIIVLRMGKKEEGLHPRWYDILLSQKYVLTKDVEIEHVLKEKDIKKCGD